MENGCSPPSLGTGHGVCRASPGSGLVGSEDTAVEMYMRAAQRPPRKWPQCMSPLCQRVELGGLRRGGDHGGFLACLPRGSASKMCPPMSSQSKLVKYFSRQLSCKKKVALQERSAELDGFPQLRHWFRIVDVRKEVLEVTGGGPCPLLLTGQQSVPWVTGFWLCLTRSRTSVNMDWMDEGIREPL